MRHNITIPSYIECEYDSALYYKAIKVFSDFGDNIVSGDKNIDIIEIYEGVEGAFFSDYVFSDHIEPDSKQITEQDLDEYLVMNEKKECKLKYGYMYTGKPTVAKNATVELPEVGSFWRCKEEHLIVKIYNTAEGDIGFQRLSETGNGVLELDEFLDRYEPTNKKYHMVNCVLCVAPFGDLGGKAAYKLFGKRVANYVGSYNPAYDIYFETEEDRDAYEAAFMKGVAVL